MALKLSKRRETLTKVTRAICKTYGEVGAGPVVESRMIFFVAWQTVFFFLFFSFFLFFFFALVQSALYQPNMRTRHDMA